MDFGYLKLYNDGNLVDAKNILRHEVICPATKEKVEEIAWTGKEDAPLALNSAHNGFEFWSSLSLYERAKWMMKLFGAVPEKEGALSKAIIYEMGKTYESSWEDIEALINGLEWYTPAMKDEQIPDYENTRHHKMLHQPAGVIARKSSLVAWVVVLIGAYVMNACYAMHMLFRNKNWNSFRVAGYGKGYILSVFVGLCWSTALGIYGQGLGLMGQIGPIIGWLMLLGLSLNISNIWYAGQGNGRVLKKHSVSY